jgi:hypothetical protein
MFPQPDIRLDLAHQIQRQRLAEAERDRLAARAAPRSDTVRRKPRRFTRAVLALVGTRGSG